MLKTESLTFAYHKNSAFSFPDIELKKKQKLLILGESGIGKTTLLHLLAGLLKPNSGSIEFLGQQFQDLSSIELDRFRGKHIGMVFQRPHFIKALSLGENLELLQYFAKLPKDKKRIMEVASSLGLESKILKKPHQLSQGEQQRAAIAMAVINHPNLILADEPTANLDDKNCERVIDLLLSQAEKTEAQLIVITHDQRLKNQFNNRLEL